MPNEIKHISINQVKSTGEINSLYPVSSADSIINTSTNELIADKPTLNDILNSLGRGAFSDGSGGSTITADLASETHNGLMSSVHFIKLRDIEEGAQKNTITGIRGSEESEFRTGEVVISKENIGLSNVENTTDAEKVVKGAGYATNDSSNQKITSTYIKKLEVVENGSLKIIRGDDTEETITIGGSGGNYDIATEETDGLMSKEYVKKLNGIEEGAQKNTITGIKGSAEAEYRTGNVEITKENIGLENVNNTSDEEKVVLSASKLTTPRTISVSGAVTGSASFDGSDNADIVVESVDASKITGMLDLSVIPAAALERCVVVPDENSRLLLTKEDVQKGDTVKVTETGQMYMVVDDEKLSDEEGYIAFSSGTAANVPWSGITGKPDSFPPEEHEHNYAASDTPGGSATSARSAGILSEEQPEYPCLWFKEISQ